MVTFENFLRYAAGLALWDFLTFALAIFGTLAALFVFRRRRHKRFSLYPSYRLNTGHSLYPNVIYFAARNLDDAPVVVCRPNFKPSKHLRIADSAHGNLATQDYELKFRFVDSKYKVMKGNSFTTVMLRHREMAVAYVGIDKTYDLASFEKMAGKKDLGWITFDIVTVGEGKPKVIRMEQKVRRIAREAHDLELGFDPARPSA